MRSKCMKLSCKEVMILYPIPFCCRAVDILKGCAASGQIEFLVARDDKSKSDFRRLSNSLQLQQQFMKRSSLTQGEILFCHYGSVS